MVKLKRPEIPIPLAMEHLPVTTNGYKKPWFVKGSDLREVDQRKYLQSMKQGKCWVCGGSNQKEFVFVSGPQLALHSASIEPPCHLECAVYAATVCPYLILPKAKRRPANRPENIRAENVDASIDMEASSISYVLTAVKQFAFRPVNESHFAIWLKEFVLWQQLWSEGTVLYKSDCGALDESILKKKIADER
ncbi:MAG: hypothetical protein JJ956_05785 [Pseudomonadales bacterium]|nr:hypothetical protein [Pseudomonadales bacterium]